jgi:hypothetical protein
MRDKLYRQLMTFSFHLQNYQCKAAVSWFACFAIKSIELTKEEKVQFT